MTSGADKHRVFLLPAHLVFVTKYRHGVFTAAHLARLEQIMRDVRPDFGAELAEFNGKTEHVHLLVNFPPTVTISRPVNSLNGVSSRRLRQEFPDCGGTTGRPSARGPGRTSPGPSAAPRSRPCGQYIEQQNRTS